MERNWSIYKITAEDGRGYVGLTRQKPRKRWHGHMHAARSGEESALYNAIRKYGPQYFKLETLTECYSEKEAKTCERALIAEHGTYVRTGRGFNVTYGGDGSYGVVFTEERLEKMRNGARAFLKRSPDHIAKMVATYNAMGRPKSPEGKESQRKLLSERKQYERTPEIREKIRASLSGVPQTEDRAAASRNNVRLSLAKCDMAERNRRISSTLKAAFSDPQTKASVLWKRKCSRNYQLALNSRGEAARAALRSAA